MERGMEFLAMIVAASFVPPSIPVVMERGME